MTRGHLEVSGHSFGYYHRKGRVFLASRGWRPRILLNTLQCRGWAFSSCNEQRLPFIVVSGLLIMVASLVAEPEF